MSRNTFQRSNKAFRRELLLGSLFLFVLLAAWAYQDQKQTLLPDFEGPSPWTEKGFLDDSDEFQFVIVSDRTGGHREGVFGDALTKINDLRPEFVMSVGDLINGSTDDVQQVAREWKEFIGLVDILQMRFFYVPGNHDIWDDAASEQWRKRFGPSYYHFIYKGVLFLCLNTQDGGLPRIGPEQVSFARRILDANPEVRWTLVFLHQPLWDYEDRSGWPLVERALQGRQHTVFAGHRHRYVSYQRDQYKYYQLATTGGGSSLNGPIHGKFDHVTWVTMSAKGPVLANLRLDGILEADLRTEPVARLTERLGGEYEIRLDPITGHSPGRGETVLHLTNRAQIPLEVRCRWDVHDRLRPTPYAFSETVAPGSTKTVKVLVQWSPGPNLTIEDALPLEVNATYRPDGLSQPVFWKHTFYTALDRTPVVERVAAGALTLDGRLDDWASLPFSMDQPQQINGDVTLWKGPQDLRSRFGLAQDEEFLYFGIQVQDDQWIHRDDKTSSYQDFVILYLDLQPPEAGSNPLGGPGDETEGKKLTLRLVPPSSAGQAIVGPGEKDLEGARILGAPSAEGYTLEGAIPHGSLDRFQGGSWKTLRWNLAARDVDSLTGSRVFLWWKPLWKTMESHPRSGVFRRY